ncbi:MAG: acyl-CoA dehydrogenase [Microbacterium sp.]|nr:acyl-CoA dehydrogenase [Microbacterium sp.]
MVTVILIDVALAGLLLVVIARARVAWHQPRARIAWLAALLGVIALLTQGTIVPLSAMDAVLGGTNILKLVQNVLTMVALWLGIQAGTAPATARIRTLRWGFPLTLAAIFAIVFFVAMPDRGPSSFLFLETAAATSTGA